MKSVVGHMVCGVSSADEWARVRICAGRTVHKFRLAIPSLYVTFSQQQRHFFEIQDFRSYPLSTESESAF